MTFLFRHQGEARKNKRKEERLRRKRRRELIDKALIYSSSDKRGGRSDI